MNNIVVVNIETVAEETLPPELLPQLEDISVGNRTDPKKIEEYRQQELEKRMSKLALFPLTGRIIVIGAKTPENEYLLEASTSLAESSMLVRFRDLLIEKEPYRIVTYNGRNFDLPYLLTAFIRHDLAKPRLLVDAVRSYGTGPDGVHIDMYKVLGEEGKLSDWCLRCGIPVPFGKGSQVKEWVQTGYWDSIREHCITNMRATYELYMRYIKGIDYRLSEKE